MTEDNNIFEEEDDEQELFEHYSFTADAKQQLLRIDKFLIDRIPNSSRTKIQEATRSENILVNGKPVKSNYRVHPFDEITILLEYPKRSIELLPENIPLDVVFEDEQILIINKQSNFVVHPGYGNYTGTLVNALMYHLNNLPLRGGDVQRPGIVHRLDKNTTGLMVIAKTELALNHLSGQFFNRTASRRYVALAWGDIEQDSGTIEGHVGRNLKNRKVMHVFPEGDLGKPAITHYKVLQRFGYVTLVECKLDTGRTHQIRVHFKYIGHPLFNDNEYGGDKILKGTTFTKYKQFIQNCFLDLPRQALHARFLSLNHPVTGERLSFESELPDDMKTVLSKWDTYVANRKD